MDGLVSEETGALLPLLAAFEAVASTGHVTQGADLLGVPQSSVSRRLRALEHTLGVALFAPAGRRVVLTAQGRDLMARIRGPLHALDGAIGAVTRDADGRTGLVRFGFPLTLGPVSVPRLLASFHDSAPGIRLTLRQAHGAELVRGLHEGELDVAVVIPPPVDLPTVPLGRQPLRLYVARGHRLAHRKRVALGELAEETFIANPPSYNLRKLLQSWCTEAGFTPRVAYEITEFDTLLALVAHDLGIAVLPDPEVPRSDVTGIALTGGDYSRGIALARTPTPLTPAAQRLHDYLATRARY
ncbi:LysR family transcriptional regulator [Mycolicibacterium sp.]|uniref:LysR family transcriptional regulator n=1 Tax=Mycolicibacterium sp. TaxID=2320850 RepID=UPI0037C51EDB